MIQRSQAIWTALQAALHRLAHWTRHNYGRVEFFEREGTPMMGFRCECGELTDVVPERRMWSE